MPVAKSIMRWPTRVTWARREDRVVPALATGPMHPSTMPNSYVRGRSRFVLSPLHLSLDQMVFLITAALLCFGLVMVQSAEMRIRGVNDNWLATAFNNKNAIHALIAVISMALVWRFDYRRLIGRSLWTSPSTILIGLTILSLLLVLSPMGMTVNGAKRWLALPLGFTKFSFQPSEFAKLGMVLFVSAYAVHQQEGVRRFFKGFIPLMLVFGITAGLVVKEDFGTTALIATVVSVMLLMAGVRLWHLGLLLPPVGLVVYKMLNTPWRRDRLLAFWDPWKDSQGAGYHLIQSLLTISNGGMWGRGLGEGIQKMGYLPEDNTDFIFAVICEELGVVGAGMVIGLFVTLAIVGWRIAARCDNLFGKMIAFGVTATIALQAAINVAVVTASMPTKGIALPFISSGGTGWIMNALALGVLMSVERVNRLEVRERARLAAPASPGLGFPVVLNAPSQAA